MARSGLEAPGTFGRDGRVRLDGDFEATGLAIPMVLEPTQTQAFLRRNSLHY
jgi:hypothetical protein